MTAPSPLSTADLTLETERLILRPFLAEDVDLTREMLLDPEVMKYVADIPEGFDVEAEHTKVCQRGAGGRIGLWCVMLKETHEKIGNVILLPLPIDLEDTDWDSVVPDRYPDAEIETGYLFRQSAWGKGYATEACRRIVRFGFEMTELDKIVAVTDPDNAASRHVLEKCGLRYLGTRRAYQYDDCTSFAISRADWGTQSN